MEEPKMKKLSKLTALALALVLMFALASCGGGQSASGGEAEPPASESQASGSGTPAAEGTVYTVGICQLVTHDALDAATQGFMDALEEALPGQVKFDLQNAANDPNTCSTIVNAFVADGVDLILANATASLQAAAAATGDIPVLGTSVTEYGVALSIPDFTGTVGGNVSGTSDLAPLDQQAAMIQELFPEASSVGLVYCSGEPNSQYQVDTVKAALEGMGYTCTLYPFADSNDAAAVVQSACDNSDVLYVPTDNTAASNTGIIDNICRPAGVPVVAGEEGICKGCGVATLSISYYDLGVTTGKMAAQILTGEADISEMPIAYAENFTPKYNPDICADLGITPPDNYVALDME